jgi:hypothetical protein
MRPRSRAYLAIGIAALTTSVAFGVAVASAETSSNGAATATSSARWHSHPAPMASAVPSGSPSASARPTTSASAGTPVCEDAFLATAPGGDTAGRLCTSLTGTSAGTVTFTAAAACRGTVGLRLSGADAAGVEFAHLETASCAGGTATATFALASGAAPGSEVCGMLFAEDRYTAALACVPII